MTQIETMLTDMYTENNRNRLQPCKEALRDDTRFFRYSVSNSIINSNHNQPLLVTRHNVSPGMVLIYKNSNMVFCDHIFNGYGYGQQDFLKQLKKSRQDAQACKYLPRNFRFNCILGEKNGNRTAWGGNINGTDELSRSIEISSHYREPSKFFDKKPTKMIRSKTFLDISSNLNEKVHLPKIASSLII